MNNSTVFKGFSILSLTALLLAGCSKEASDVQTDERVEISPQVTVAGSVEAAGMYNVQSKAPQDGMANLDFYFARQDQSLNDATMTPYATTALKATRTAGAGAQNLTFNPKQYYLPGDRMTKMVGWYPGGATAANEVSGNGFYDGTAKSVSWTFDGTQDIMIATVQQGNITTVIPAFTFNHKLTQLQFFPYVSSVEAQTAWGNVTAIEVTAQRNTCKFEITKNETSGAVTFTGDADKTLSVQGGVAALPPIGSAKAVQFGQPMMIEPQAAATYELTLKVTTQNGGVITAKVQPRAYAEGKATIVRLELTVHNLYATAEIAPWVQATNADADADPNGSSSSYYSVPCYYGDANNNGAGISNVNVLGSTLRSYNSYRYTGTTGTNGVPFDRSVYAKLEPPFAKLEVALTDEEWNSSSTMSGGNAWKACAAKTTGGGGWRLPRLSEFQLIYNNRYTLAKANTGFVPLVNKDGHYYWTGTESIEGATKLFGIFTVDNSGYFTTDVGYCHVRCVREAVPNSVRIGNLEWATGNLVASGTHGCRIGLPTDVGLYFQFGSLIGWKGGSAVSEGRGEGVNTYTTNGKYWNNMTSLTWNNDAMVWPAEMSGNPTAWPNKNAANVSTLNYYFNYSETPWDRDKQNMHEFAKPIPGDKGTGMLGTGRYAKLGVGDPCSYYLGDKWRLPTMAELAALAGQTGEATVIHGQSTTRWVTTSNTFSGINALGMWCGPGMGPAVTPDPAKHLFLPAAGHRNVTNGSFTSIEINGTYWSTSVHSNTGGYYLYFDDKNGIFTPLNHNRSHGFSVRCVRDVQ